MSKETLPEGCSVPDKLEAVDGGGGDAGEECVAVVEAGGGEGLDESFGSGGVRGDVIFALRR